MNPVERAGRPEGIRTTEGIRSPEVFRSNRCRISANRAAGVSRSSVARAPGLFEGPPARAAFWRFGDRIRRGHRAAELIGQPTGIGRPKCIGRRARRSAEGTLVGPRASGRPRASVGRGLPVTEHARSGRSARRQYRGRPRASGRPRAPRLAEGIRSNQCRAFSLSSGGCVAGLHREGRRVYSPAP